MNNTATTVKAAQGFRFAIAEARNTIRNDSDCDTIERDAAMDLVRQSNRCRNDDAIRKAAHWYLYVTA